VESCALGESFVGLRAVKTHAEKGSASGGDVSSSITEAACFFAATGREVFRVEVDYVGPAAELHRRELPTIMEPCAEFGNLVANLQHRRLAGFELVSATRAFSLQRLLIRDFHFQSGFTHTGNSRKRNPRPNTGRRRHGRKLDLGPVLIRVSWPNEHRLAVVLQRFIDRLSPLPKTSR